MLQIAAGIFLVIGGISLIVFGAANHIADPAVVRFVGVKSVTLENPRTGDTEIFQPEDVVYLRPGSGLVVNNVPMGVEE